MKLTLKLLAPYFAIGIFWIIFRNAWLSIFAYHLQIVVWNFKKLKINKFVFGRLAMGTLITSAPAGIVVYFLLPHISKIELNKWFDEFGISENSLWFLIPYFGIVHPFLEQKHWDELRNITFVSHLAFAGYHSMVLVTLLKKEWIYVSLAILVSISLIWKTINKKDRTDSASILSHILADLGIITAAFLRL